VTWKSRIERYRSNCSSTAFEAAFAAERGVLFFGGDVFRRLFGVDVFAVAFFAIVRFAFTGLFDPAISSPPEPFC